MINFKTKTMKDLFNDICINLPKVYKLTQTRKNVINARIKEYDYETVIKVFEIVSKSDFLNGKNSRGWTADFDWILKPANFLKILEGNYKNKVGLETQYKICSWQDLSDMSVKNKDVFNDYIKIKIPSGFGYVRKDDFKRYNLVEYKNIVS